MMSYQNDISRMIDIKAMLCDIKCDTLMTRASVPIQVYLVWTDSIVRM